MKFKDIINSSMLKSVGKYAGVVVAGVAAITSALEAQKQEKELEDLKKAVSDLQNKE